MLVATSGEPASDGAIRVAAALARQKDGSVELLTVANPFPHAAPTAFQVAVPPVIDADSRRIAIERVRAQLVRLESPDTWPIVAATGWAVDAIRSVASRWPASLIVLGLGEHGILDRLIGTETAVKMAHCAHAPLLAVPADASTSPTHAVAAIDFSEASITAARVAANLVDRDGTLTLAHASMFAGASNVPGSVSDLYTTGARARLELVRMELQRDVECHIDTAVLSGEITECLLDFAAREGCDLIAIGGHERGLLDRVVFGSVRSKVMRRSHYPVLVVPPEEEDCT